MRLVAEHRTHRLPKRGHRADENEDAAAGPAERRGAARAAVADGATESAFAGVWAQALAEAWVKYGQMAAAVEAARSALAAHVAERTPSLAWYAAAKVEEGAFATLLGLEVRRDGGWSAEAIGDTCLFQLRGDETVLTWPFSDPDAFSNRPALLGSQIETPTPEKASGRWEAGDRFLLGTDALAAFLLRHGPAATLDLGADAFAAFVEDARERGMRNDDVTLVEIVLR